MINKDEKAKTAAVMHPLVGFVVGALFGLSLVAVCMIFPFAGIRKTNPLLTEHWQELSVFAACFAGGLLGLGRVLASDPESRKMLLHRNLQLSDELAALQFAQAGFTKLSKLFHRFAWLLGLLFFFLYCASIALCLRLNICTLETQPTYVVEALRTAGALIVVAAVVLQIKSVFVSFAASTAEQTRFTSTFRIRHPILLGWLLLFLGLPLAFGVWMPLIAIPGCYIGLRSWVKQQETALISQFGESFEAFTKNTWSIVPYLSKLY